MSNWWFQAVRWRGTIACGPFDSLRSLRTNSRLGASWHPGEDSNLQQAFRLALSLVLLCWLALAMNWDMPKYGALAIVLISLDTFGASMTKGVLRVVG